MAKRFTDTGIYSKAWFRKLPVEIKCLWEWLRSECDHAGVVDFDPELASFQIGAEISNESLEYFGDRIERIGNDKIWLVDFVKFQYGELKENYNPHKPVLNSLKKHDLFSRVHQDLSKTSPSLVDKDKDKDKAKDKDKDKEKDKDKDKETQSLGAIPQFSKSESSIELLETVSHTIQKKWIEIYQDPNWINTEIIKASTWMDANPQKKPKSGFSRFLTNWMNRAWEQHRKSTPGQSYGRIDATEQARLNILNNPYLQEVSNG